MAINDYLEIVITVKSHEHGSTSLGISFWDCIRCNMMVMIDNVLGSARAGAEVSKNIELVNYEKSMA